MGITIDTGPIEQFFQLPIDQALYILLVNFAWIPVAITFLWGAALLWKFSRNIMYDNTLGYTLLAIDIPRGNEQSVKAVENIFTYLAGAHKTFNLIEIWWKGEFQQGFSLEIVSIEGYTQFLIWTPAQYQNLVESAIYSQYPDAEITVVNDYTESVPTRYPNDEWDAWGGEFIYAKPDAYPIKTYKEFGDDLGRPDSQFKDPMASLMDLCSSLGKGEQLWYQIIVYPTGFDWPGRMQKEVKKILKEKSGGSIFGSMGDGVADWANKTLDQIFGGESDRMQNSQEEEPLKMLQLKPQEKKQVEAIQHKASQLGFEVKNRFVYVAKKEVINKNKVRNGFVGYMKQFMDLDLNNLKPDMDMTVSTANYFFEKSIKEAKKTRIVSAYKGRSGTRGRLRYIMNIEELATLWHFPIETAVKAPLVQKAPGRKAEAPMSLPQREESISDRITKQAPGQDNDIFGVEEEVMEEATKKQMPPAPAAPPAAQPPKGNQEESNIPWQDEKVINLKETKETSNTEKKGVAPGNLPFA